MGITRTVTTRVHCDVCGEWVTGWESEGIGISREWAKYFVRLQGCTAGKRIICKECRIKQRIKKCSLQKKYGVAGMDGGACLGFSYDGDDEPIERCKDYYVYICDSRIDSADEKYVISLNSTYPTGWNATNSRKIGGFHYGRCRKVDSNLQPLNGSSVIFGTGWESAVSNGIVPRSVWTLGHRPKCSPEGMVYLGGGTWVDIYLNSDDGAKGLKSEYGCAPMTGTESMNWYNFVERLAKSGKRLPNYAEFCAYAFGSPAGLDNANTNAWSATSNTGRGVTGSAVNAVSSVGVVDAVGRVWEWLDELITRAEHATNADYHASVAWGWDKKSPLNTGEKSYDVGNIYQYYAYSLAALVAGGSWSNGASCGARAVGCNYCPWDVTAYVGARGACDSL